MKKIEKNELIDLEMQDEDVAIQINDAIEKNYHKHEN